MSENVNNVVEMTQEIKSKKSGLKKVGIVTGVAAVAGALVVGAFKMFGNKKEDDLDFEDSFTDEDTLEVNENITQDEETEE